LVGWFLAGDVENFFELDAEGRIGRDPWLANIHRAIDLTKQCYLW
jgi:hypothetical protein